MGYVFESIANRRSLKECKNPFTGKQRRRKQLDNLEKGQDCPYQ